MKLDALGNKYINRIYSLSSGYFWFDREIKTKTPTIRILNRVREVIWKSIIEIQRRKLSYIFERN